MWNNLFRPMDVIQTGLEASWTRNAVIRNNLANIETPGFQASDVEFESLLRQAIEGDTGFDSRRTHENHIRISSGFQGAVTNERHIQIGSDRRLDPSDVRAQIIQREGTAMRYDGNNVCIESENVKLAQNSLLYETLLAKLNSEISRLRMAITESR